jgi:hypothetical protein
MSMRGAQAKLYVRSGYHRSVAAVNTKLTLGTACKSPAL